MLAIGKNAESFEYKDVTYDVEKEGEDLYLIPATAQCWQLQQRTL